MQKKWETPVFEENSFTLRAFFFPISRGALAGGDGTSETAADKHEDTLLAAQQSKARRPMTPKPVP
eukprot:3554405-Amphidinium_carterae.1